MKLLSLSANVCAMMNGLGKYHFAQVSKMMDFTFLIQLPKEDEKSSPISIRLIAE